MGFKKGHSGNPQGRRKGAKGRTPEELRKALQSFIDRNFENLQQEFDSLDAEKKLLFMEKLLRHILPRPLNELDRLTDEQLDELIKRLKNHEI